MWAIVVKEFRQLRRDRRTVAMMTALPVLLLVVFGYAARLTVSSVPTVVVGPRAAAAAAMLPHTLRVVAVLPGAGEAAARSRLRSGDAVVGVVTGGARTVVLLDGTQLFSVQAAERALAARAAASAAAATAAAPPAAAPTAAAPTTAAPTTAAPTTAAPTTAAPTTAAPPVLRVLYNPSLSTTWVMVPGLAGLILVFVGTLITSLGVVRERQAGTLEQLAVMPFRSADVVVGKIAPYLLVAAVDLGVILAVGMGVFGVPFAGNVGVFVLGAALFLLVTLGMGVLISTVSQNQGQAIQLALMAVMPQVLLSGLIFPVGSMALGVRWISYVLPLTYFVDISRGVMLKDAPLSSLWPALGLLALLGAVVFGLAVARFRRDLAPPARHTPAPPQPSRERVPA